MSVFLLVEIEDAKAAGFENDVMDVTGVLSVIVHGRGCCCKNCPWSGDHGQGGWEDVER